MFLTLRFPVLAAGEVDSAISTGLVLLDFWQESCAPCRALEPRLEAFARAHRGAFRGYRIDVDSDPGTAARFAVMSIPTLIWFLDGQRVGLLDGLVLEPDLETSLAEVTRRQGAGEVPPTR